MTWPRTVSEIRVLQALAGRHIRHATCFLGRGAISIPQQRPGTVVFPHCRNAAVAGPDEAVRANDY
jgi:hypothetical protein